MIFILQELQSVPSENVKSYHLGTLRQYIRRVRLSHGSYLGESQYNHDKTKEPDMSPQRTKKKLLGIYRTQILPSDHDNLAILGQ